MEVYSCFVNNEKYYFTYNDPKYYSKLRKYRGVAQFWKEGDDNQKDTVPFSTKEDEIDLTHQKIEEQIEQKVKIKSASKNN